MVLASSIFTQISVPTASLAALVPIPGSDSDYAAAGAPMPGYLQKSVTIGTSGALETCAQLALSDNHIGDFGQKWKPATPTDANYTYYHDLAGPQAPPQPTYRAAGFSFVTASDQPTQVTCTLYTADALPLLAPVEVAAGTTESSIYYDLNCQNGGSRVSAIRGGPAMHYCLCNQGVPDPTKTPEEQYAGSMFEGERCTVPKSFLHTNDVHPAFNQVDGNYLQGAMSPAAARWRSSFPRAHPSGGYAVHQTSGVPLPLAAWDPTGNSLDPINVPQGYSIAATTSGQCGTTAGLLSRTAKCNISSGSSPIGTLTGCFVGCPSAAPTAMGAALANGAITPRDATTGTLGGTPGTCTTGPESPCTAGCGEVISASAAACTKEPPSFVEAAKTYAVCMANARAMIKSDTADRAMVSTWSAAQQNSLNQLLAGAGNSKCSTSYNTSHETIGLHWVPVPGVDGGEDATSANSVNCEAIFESAEALSAYNASINCTLNSVQNCQSAMVCSDQTVDAVFDLYGNKDTVNITQSDTTNLNASANYTTQFINTFANETHQTLDAVISQFNSQMKAAYAEIDASIAAAKGGQLPSSGPRSFANIAAAISNITENAVSNQINNNQVTEAITQQKIQVQVTSHGDNLKADIQQTATTDMQVSMITQNSINNSFTNTTTQVLTATTNQTNKDPLSGGLSGGIGIIVLFVVLLIGIAVAGFFVFKLSKKGLHVAGKIAHKVSAKAQASMSDTSPTPPKAQASMSQTSPTSPTPT